MNITMNEREILMRNMKELLDEYDYDYSTDALDVIIDEWADQKAPLIEAFKKHPNYVEGKFMIAFSVNYDRVIDPNTAYAFSQWLTRRVMEGMVETLPADINEARLNERCRLLPNDLYEFLDGLKEIAAKTITAETAEKINQMLPKIRASEGQKTSRVINKICTYLGYNKHPDYNREYAKYADALSPLAIKRHTILSINPLDYLTMSFGNSWASCHTIDKKNKRGMPNAYQGQYSSGTMSYMLDPSSMVLYTVDASYDGNDYWNQPKINRQMFHYGEEKLVQSRLYPQDNDDLRDAYTPYRNIVQGIMATIFDFPNLWTINRGQEYAKKYIYSSGTHYRDYCYFDNCTLSRISGSTNENTFDVGAEPICIQCGDTHSIEHAINCCGTKVRCNKCGALIDEEDARYVGDDTYCNDCCHYCERCGEYHLGEETWIESESRFVCEWCLDNRYERCAECEEYYDVESMTYLEHSDNHICSACRDEYYTLCEECDEYYRDDEVTERDGRYLCEDCCRKADENEEENEDE